jgi:hypothetical protein
MSDPALGWLQTKEVRFITLVRIYFPPSTKQVFNHTYDELWGEE